jgi:hypothetical protein
MKPRGVVVVARRMWRHALASCKFINIRIRPLQHRGRVVSRVQFRNKDKTRAWARRGRTTRGEKRRRRCEREGRLTAGRGLCAPHVISNVPGCRDSTLMERVALTPVFARQARRSSGVVRASMPPSSTGTNGFGKSPLCIDHPSREETFANCYRRVENKKFILNKWCQETIRYFTILVIIRGATLPCFNNSYVNNSKRIQNYTYKDVICRRKVFNTLKL